MRKILSLALLASLAFAMDSKINNGVKPSGEIVLDKEYEKSAKIFKASCEKGHMYNCFNLGKFYKDGRGVIKSKENALKYFEIACNGKLSYGCYMIGQMAYEDKDYKKAVQMYKQSCNMNYEKACLKLAEAYYAGEGVEKSLKMAKELSEKACNMGSEKACKAYNNLSKQLKK